MNYRHAFHAGGFTDVLKHAVLAQVLVHLRSKPKPFRVLDLHAGEGFYDLRAQAAERTAEWNGGIGRLLSAPLPTEAAAFLEPYLDAVRAANPDGTLRFYPGSPWLIARALRSGDRALAYESAPDTAARLQEQLGLCPGFAIKPGDGWAALTSLPPPERRGAILIDPAFEDAHEFDRVAEAVSVIRQRWTTGTAIIWYPISPRARPERFVAGVAALGFARALRVELAVAPHETGGPLGACGLVVLNPPWTLRATLERALPVLAETLARRGRGRSTLEIIGTGG